VQHSDEDLYDHHDEPGEQQEERDEEAAAVGLELRHSRVTFSMMTLSWSLSFFMRLVSPSIFPPMGCYFCSMVSCSSLMFFTFCLSPLMPTVMLSTITSNSKSLFLHFFFCSSSS
jgi:hypothetical protein